MKQLLTHSRMQSFKSCRRKNFYGYELGLRPTDDARALRMGSAFHAGIECLGRREGVAAACESVRAAYSAMPSHYDEYDWLIERETILRLVCAYDWRWQQSGIEDIRTEFRFDLPLVNPSTGAPTNVFGLAGKIDGIVKLEDGRLAVKETKTVSEDVGPDSPMWRRLRMDHQISLYIYAARQSGFQVDTVLYDVVRKPTIEATQVPLLDENGLKVVLDLSGNRVRNLTGKKDWRQTGDKEKGYVLQTRPMLIDEWGDKLSADIGERPEFYFARVEIPRLNQDVDECLSEVWEIQQAIREAQKSNRWYRTVDRNTCPYCPYFDLCSTNQEINQASPPPGFQFLADVHPELEGVPSGNTSTEAASASNGTAAEAASETNAVV